MAKGLGILNFEGYDFRIYLVVLQFFDVAAVCQWNNDSLCAFLSSDMLDLKRRKMCGYLFDMCINIQGKQRSDASGFRMLQNEVISPLPNPRCLQTTVASLTENLPLSRETGR